VPRILVSNHGVRTSVKRPPRSRAAFVAVYQVGHAARVATLTASSPRTALRLGSRFYVFVDEVIGAKRRTVAVDHVAATLYPRFTRAALSFDSQWGA